MRCFTAENFVLLTNACAGGPTAVVLGTAMDGVSELKTLVLSAAAVVFLRHATGFNMERMVVHCARDIMEWGQWHPGPGARSEALLSGDDASGPFCHLRPKSGVSRGISNRKGMLPKGVLQILVKFG